MKKRHLFLILAFIAIVSSCSKDPIVSNDQYVGRSKITYYANIVLTGETSISVVQGVAFTDPGVKATSNGADVPVTTTGSVDTSTPGIYTLNYSATNAD